MPGVPSPGQDAQALHGCPGGLCQQRQQCRRDACSTQQRSKQRWRPAGAQACSGDAQPGPNDWYDNQEGSKASPVRMEIGLLRSPSTW